MYGTCTVEFPYTAKLDGDYTISATTAAIREGIAHPDAVTVNLLLAVNTAVPAMESTANGAITIKQLLVDLHHTLLGKSYDTDSAEIEVAYQLFVESWLERLDLGYPGNLIGGFEEELCEWWRDEFFFDDLPFEGEVKYLDYTLSGYPRYLNTEAAGNFLSGGAYDPLHVKDTWVTIITYLLTHYHYLYE